MDTQSESGSLTGNPLIMVDRLGQAIWLDYIRRDILTDGTLHRLIQNDAVKGVTSNPAIFEQAITSDTLYKKVIENGVRLGMEPAAIYEQVVVEDIRLAADILFPVYEKTSGVDGFVSLEVSPHLANQTETTCKEARRLWLLVDRPNLMIKVPATDAGILAIKTLVGEGLNINVTLLFSREVYRHVANAYIEGINTWMEQGGDPARVAGVASFFVSRIDSVIDSLIEDRLKGAMPAEVKRLESLQGKVAVANAKLAYQDYLRLFDQPGWKRLAKQGAGPQRLLWA
ncbi:MAG: transaldolase, partial [Pseudohongiellaceae bacterium]